MEFKPYFSLQWHITNMCDQRCKHCYIYAGKDKKCQLELDLETLVKILNNFVDFCDKVNKRPYLVITGGDPLLYSNVWEFLNILHDRNIRFSILGNPFHLNPDVVKVLEELGCISYQMSLDGLKNTHDFIRKPGSFDATLEALDYFKNSKIKTNIMTTVSKTNIDEIPQLVDIVVKHGSDSFSFARYCPNPGDENLMPTPDEYKKFLGKMWKKYQKYKDSKTAFPLKDHLWTLFLYEKGLFDINKIKNPNNLILDGCHCAITHMTVLANGDVYACRRSNSKIGKVPEQSFYDIFTSKKMDEYRQYDKFKACSKCELRNFCRGCPSVTKCLTGDFYEKDPQCWKKI